MTPRKILVVDDNEDSARLLSLLLETMGYDAQCAFCGAEAITVATDYRPDTIVLDLSLPDIDGFELAGRLRALAGLDTVTLIAVTGWSDSDLARRARALGFAAFLVKPVAPAQLDRVLGGAPPA